MNAAILGALAEPHRLHIVELLVREPLTVGEIAARSGLRQPQASKHVRVLVDAGRLTDSLARQVLDRDLQAVEPAGEGHATTALIAPRAQGGGDGEALEVVAPGRLHQAALVAQKRSNLVV